VVTGGYLGLQVAALLRGAMFTTVHSLLAIVLQKLLEAAGLLAKDGLLAEGAAQQQAWQVLCRRFPEIRSQRDGSGAA
jgi:hypothetical protein